MTKKKNYMVNAAERFENKISKWNLLKLVAECWTNDKLKVWQKQILLHHYLTKDLTDNTIFQSIGNSIKRLQRDRDRARRLIIKIYDEDNWIDDDLATEIEKYMTYSRKTNVGEV